MKQCKIFRVVFFFLFSFLFAFNTYAGNLPREWTEIDPADYGFEYNGLTPACSNCPGTPDDKFTFFVKGGKKNKLVIFFQGGGACWDTINCVGPYGPETLTYHPYQQEELWMFQDGTLEKGIFDPTKNENPFKDWGIVFIPNCTGDLFWGANDANYDGVEIKHRGFVNFLSVLTYLQNTIKQPKKIFIAGSSAGSYGAILSFPYIKESFPKSKFYMLGDSGMGVIAGNFVSAAIQNWDIQVPEWVFPDGFDENTTVPQIYTQIASTYSSDEFAQYTTAFDGVQVFFYKVMLNLENPAAWEITGPNDSAITEWHFMMKNNVYSTAEEIFNYRYYIGSGIDHTLLRSDKFYTEDTAEGVSFVKWLKRMLRTKKKNLECEPCLP